MSKKIKETKKTTKEKVEELKVITIGATDEEAYYIGQIFTFINRENLDKLKGELSRFNGAIYTIEKPLNLYKKALSLIDRKSTRLNSSHVRISYAVFCLKKKKKKTKKKNIQK